MKRKITSLLTAWLLLMTGLIWGQTRTEIHWVASEQGYDNGEVIDAIEFDANVTATFNNGSNSNGPKYYNTGQAIRCYGGNYFTFTSTQGDLTEIALSFGSGDGSNAITTDVGDFDGTTWTGSSSSVTFTIGGSSGHRRIAVFDITYSSGGTTSVATPTFSPAGGTYGEPQTVTISCTTPGATIYYTTDNTVPTTESDVYSSPLTISEPTTLKAIGVKAGMNNSNVATATYTIMELVTLTSIEDIWDYAEEIGGDATPVLVTFNNWYVTGVRNNQVCVSDGQYGFVIYQSGHGFTAGDKLNGSVACNVLMYQNHYAELTGVHASDLTVTPNQEMPILDTTIDDLELRNYGTPIDLGVLTYNGSAFEDEVESIITPYNNFNLNPNPITSLVEGQQYEVKGVFIIYWQNSEIFQIAPRYEDDFELVGDPGETVATPTFTPASGTYSQPQNVTISCTTNGATIYYTTDGTNPTTNSSVYSSPLTISETTTVKAMGVKSGMNNSNIATATYTIESAPSIITIAEARALENDQYALVEGVVTFIDGRNVYIQDETAGIDLYLNANAPSTLALGDKVQAYGKRALFKGLVELSGIDGTNEDEFNVVSTGNQLPLAVKTIAEINSDFAGSNALQSTRVQIVDATIGAINTGGNTPLSQGENSINIYRIPSVDGLLEGDIVTVNCVIGCYNSVQLRVASADDVSFQHGIYPVLTATPSSLTGLNYVYGEGPSQALSFALSGNNLEGPVHVYPSESFEISSVGGENFVPESVITINGATQFNNILVYVRLKEGLEVGSYQEEITASSENANTISIHVSGSVTSDQPPVLSNYTRISDVAQLTDGAKVIFAARFDEDANSYYAMSNHISGKIDGVLFTSAMAPTGGETLPSAIADEEELYYWTLIIDGSNYIFTNAEGNVLGYSSGTNFATGGDNTDWTIEFGTADPAAMVPEYQGFVVTNANNTGRAFALNATYHSYGVYSKSNMTGNNAAGYNFYLDMFVTTEGGTMTCATPSFTPAGGTYYEVQEVTINCATPDATIHYTLDGSNPTVNSAVYNGPITISESTTLKAIAMKEGYDDSSIAEAQYVIVLGAATIFYQDWEGDMNGWTFVTVEGNKAWTIAVYNNNHYAYANGYNGGVNEQWCISPAFNLEAYSDVTLSFRNAMNYTGPDLQLFFSNDYDGNDPSEATWTELEFEKSSGSYTWTESGVIELNDFGGTNCYIGFKYTSTETQAAAWEVDDISLMGFTSDPYLTVLPNALTGFTHVVGEGPSASQTFVITAGNITPAPGGTSGSIYMTVESPFSISLDDDEYSNDIYFEDITNLEPTTIYVRMNATEIGQYSGVVNVNCSTSYLDTEVTLNGTVTEPLQGGDWNRIGSLADLHDGDQVVIASRYDATVGNGYYAMTAGVSGKPDGVLFTSVIDNGVETLPSSFVADIETFLWNVTVNDTIITLTNVNGDALGYNSSTNFAGNESIDWAITFATAGDNAMVPNYSGFVITNVITSNRGIAKNANNKFGAYHTSNLNNGDYNFYLDLFVQGGTATQTVATPVFSMNSGTYYEEIDVEISCATEGAAIRYTTDGSNPTASSTLYTGAIHVSSDMTIKAIGIKDDYENSNIATVNYVIILGQNIIFSQNWEGDMNGWTFVTEQGNKPWNVSSYGGNQYAYANGYNDDTDNKQWCISPMFDLTNLVDVTLTFRNAKNYNGPELELFFSNDYDGRDPRDATWHPLVFNMSAGGYAWTESGEISLDGFSGENCFIGFLYTSTLEDGAAAWEIDDILLCGTVDTTNLDEEALTGTRLWNHGNEMFVENGTNNDLQLMVYNLLGQPVFNKTVGVGAVRFAHNLANGLYIVTLQQGNERMTTKMIVK